MKRDRLLTASVLAAGGNACSTSHATARRWYADKNAALGGAVAAGNDASTHASWDRAASGFSSAFPHVAWSRTRREGFWGREQVTVGSGLCSLTQSLLIFALHAFS